MMVLAVKSFVIVLTVKTDITVRKVNLTMMVSTVHPVGMVLTNLCDVPESRLVQLSRLGLRVKNRFAPSQAAVSHRVAFN